MAFDRNKLFTNWIWTPDWGIGDDHEARVVYFRKEINLTDLPEHKEIRITADSRYKLYVNGEFVGEGPQKALDTREWYVDTADLIPYLNTGKNVVAVEVLRFPELVLKGMQFNANGSLYRTEIPHLYVEDLSEPQIVLQGKSGWKCFVNRKIHIFGDGDGGCIQPQENAEIGTGLSGWKKTGYDDTGWKTAVPWMMFELLYADAPGTLVPRTIPVMRHTEKKFEGVKEVRDAGNAEKKQLEGQYGKMLAGTGFMEIPPYTEQVVELSAGVEECGYLLYAFAGGAGAKVTTLCSECYVSVETDPKSGQKIPVKRMRDDSIQGVLMGPESSYTVGGYGTVAEPEVYEPYWFRTFRYIKLHVKTEEEPLQFLKFQYRSTGYPLDVKTKFQIPDHEYQNIWDISIRTLKRCMHETYVDCPFYEQYQYAMDTRSEILYTYAVSADDRLARQAMEAFRRSQRPDGMTAANAPGVKTGVIPGFSIYYILMVYDHMMYFGDPELVRHHFPAIEGVLAFFEHHLNEKGIVGKTGGRLFLERYWSFIDWSPAWQESSGMPQASDLGTGAVTMESLLYIYGLQKASELAAYIGSTEIAREYGNRAEYVKNAIRKYCIEAYQEKNGECHTIILDGPGIPLYSVHCQVFAVLTGLLDAADGGKILQLAIGNPDFAQPSVAFMFYVFRALEQCGRYDKTDTLWNAWREMLHDHLTTCVENETDRRSDCHAWGALMCYEIPAAILGVTPAAPGYAKVRIAPQPCKLKEAEGEVITPKGTVHVEWTRGADGSCKVEYSVPDGMEVCG